MQEVPDPNVFPEFAKKVYRKGKGSEEPEEASKGIKSQVSTCFKDVYKKVMDTAIESFDVPLEEMAFLDKKSEEDLEFVQSINKKVGMHGHKCYAVNVIGSCEFLQESWFCFRAGKQ